MSINSQQINPESYRQYALNQLIDEHINLSSPIAFYLTNDSCILDAEITLAVTTQPIGYRTPTIATPTFTLVVFDDITLHQLQQLSTQCQLTIYQLNTIQHRLAKTCWRFKVTSDDIQQSRQQLVNFCEHYQIEAALLSKTPVLTQPGLLVMDMDSTAIQMECIDEIAKLAGVGERVAAVTERAMQGELDFAASLRERVATLKGAPESILAEVAAKMPLTPGLSTLVETLKAHQWRVAIASGGFTYFAEKLKQQLGLDAIWANNLEIVNQELTGQVEGAIVDATAKAQCIRALAKQYNIAHEQTVAIGDGANDLLMMEAAQLGVAFDAKPKVKQQADACINEKDLTLLLHWLE